MINLEIIAIILCLAAIIFYICSGVLFCLKKDKVATIYAVIGWFFNLGIFIKNWYINGYLPFASMYQVLSDISLLFVVIMLVIKKFFLKYGWISHYFSFGASVPLIGTLFMDRNMHWSLAPALRSPFFVPHVFSYVLSYALCAVAFLISVVGLIKKTDIEKAEKAVYFVIRIAFPFMVAGLLLGAIWADQVWGNFWSWDIKEVWSLITVAFYLCYFHARKVKTMKRYVLIFEVIGFATLIFTFLCVNVLPNIIGSLHTYT